MADYSAKATNMARGLAITHVIVGSVLICFGIADSALMYHWTGLPGCGVWMGVWMCIGGGLGISGTRKVGPISRNACVFMGFSITSAVFGATIIVVYSLGIATYGWWYMPRDYNQSEKYRRNTQMVLSAIMLILGFVEVVIGIWAPVCLCLMKPCTCCKCCRGTSPQQEQMMYTANPSYSMTHFPVVGPASVPVKTAGSMVAVHIVTPRAQEGQPQVVVIPVSGADSVN